MRILLAAAIVTAISIAADAGADEGQWTPDQIAELDPGRLAAMGLNLAPQQIYNAQDGGLMRAAVNYGGCSASFISPDGLIATNYHCAYGDLQSQSTPERDYIQDGFLAAERGSEIQAKNRGTAEILLRVSDVSDEIREVSANATDDGARADAVKQATKRIVARCEDAAPNRKCKVASFYGGVVHRLFESLELRDLRIVYAPPAGVGEYGGDVDNWMWPRHTGDFALLRAYVAPDGSPRDPSPDNVPYHPARWLKVSPNGVEPGDFIMLMGYPGRTQRYLPASEIARQVDQVLPGVVDLYAEWITLLELQGARSKEVAIKVAAIKKSLANREKNARGMLDGIARMDLLARRQQRDAQLAAFSQTPAGERFAGLFGEIEALVARRRQHHARAFLLAALRRGLSLTPLAIDLTRSATNRRKPDLERESLYMDRNQKALLKLQQRRLRNFDLEVEAHLLASAVDHAQQQGIDVPAFTLLRRDAEAGGGLLDAVRTRISASKLNDADTVARLFESASLEELDALNDPLLALAKSLTTSIEQVEAEADALDGAALRVDPHWFSLLRTQHSGPLYPDANGTLRFSYASVQGYAPRDGLWATPHTTLAGAVAKHRGSEPFDLPDKVRAAAPDAKNSYWAAPDVGDVPLCFLSNADTTGGNSGSAVINGRGELVGLNFDRVWENIAGDFGYNPVQSRNIIADARYLLWLLDRVADAGALLSEMGLSEYRTAAPRRAESKPRPAPRNAVGCSLSGATTPARPLGWAWLLGLTLMWVRRRNFNV